MEIVAPRLQLQADFAKAAAGAMSRATNVLTNVLIKAGDGEIELQATDTDNSISVTVPCEVAKPGRVLLPKDKMGLALKEFDGPLVKIRTKDNIAEIECGRAVIKLPTANPDEFPKPPDCDITESFTVDWEILEQGFDQTTFATDPDSSRYALGGVLLTSEDGSATIVASDGRRLACTELPVEWQSNNMPIISERTISLMKRAAASGPCVVGVGQNWVVFKSDNVRVLGRLIEGRFPNWRQVIPNVTDFDTVTADSEGFAAAIRQASLVGSPESRGVECSFESETIRLACSTQDIGESNVTCRSTSTIVHPVGVKVDYRFLLDYLSAAEKDSVTIYVKSPMHPVLLQQGRYRYVVMGMASQ